MVSSEKKYDWKKSFSDWKLPTIEGKRFVPPGLLKIAEEKGVMPGTLEFDELIIDENKRFNALHPRTNNGGEEEST